MRAALMLIFVAACAENPSPLTVADKKPGIAPEALVVAEGDKQKLDSVEAVRIGSAARADRYALCLAAKDGGTHLVPAGKGKWDVVRVERPRWRELPDALRPRSADKFPEPIWNGDPQIWECYRYE